MIRVLLAALCLCSQPLWADTVHLKDGTSVQGSIIGAGTERIEVNTINGSMLIPRERITAIEIAPSEITPTAPPMPPAAAPPPDFFPRKPAASQEAPGFGPGADILSLQFGLAIPISQVSFSPIGGGNALNGDVGAILGLQYLHQLGRRLGLGLEFEYADRSTNETFGLFPSGVAYVSGDSLIFMGEGRWDLRDHGSVRPYVLGGLGAHRTTETIDARPFPGSFWATTFPFDTRQLIDDDLWGLASCVRFGVDFPMDHNASVGFDLSWLRLGAGTFHATPQGQAVGLTGVSGALDIISLAARIAFVL
jgi:opacity protein-like surface antigen